MKVKKTVEVVVEVDGELCGYNCNFQDIIMENFAECCFFDCIELHPGKIYQGKKIAKRCPQCLETFGADK